MEKEDRLAVVKDTLKNIDGITIVDYVEISKKNELDNNFKKLTGHEITVNGEHYPWVPIEYVNSLTVLDKTQKIPDGFEFINVICAKHIGVACEIICYAKIDKDCLEKEVEIRAKETHVYPDIFPYSKVMNELHARLKYLESLQAALEGFMKPLVPGIFLRTDRNVGKNLCPSFWVYRLDNKYNPFKVEEPFYTIPKVVQVHNWIEKFAFEIKNEEWGPFKYSDLSFLNWNFKKPFSLIKEDFIIGHGRFVKPDEMGAYTNQYIILGLKDIDIRDLGSFESISLHHLVVELSKFLLPFHWIRRRFKELEGYEKDILEPIEFPTLMHDKKHKELSKDLEQLMKIYDDENRKRAQSIPFFSNIGDETKCLKSLREGLDKLRGEEEEFIGRHSEPSVSSTILGDIDFLFDKVSEKMEDIKSKQLSRIQYLRDQINATTSFIDVKLTERVSKLTWGVVILTAIMVVLLLSTFLR